MLVSDLGDRLTASEYAPDKSGRATVQLDGGVLVVTIPYNFYAIDGSFTPIINVDGIATAQQLADLKTILVAILQATNTDIENTYGWTKYVDPAP